VRGLCMLVAALSLLLTIFQPLSKHSPWQLLNTR
jgi:hypothetical protein